MAIKAAPVTSPKVFLGDLSPAVAVLEGDCPEKDRAWVIIRQATEGDVRVIQDYGAETRTVFSDDRTEQIQHVNQADVRAKQVHLTLSDAGNIVNAQDEPLFRFDSGRLAMDFNEFQTAYGTLHPDVTRAMLLAVRDMNPIWDWAVSQWVRCPNCKVEFVLKDRHLLPLAETRDRAEQES